MAVPHGRENAPLVPAGAARPPAPEIDEYDGLDERLWAEPYRYSFFQAIRLLQKRFPDRAPVGLDVHPSTELVRFRAHLSMVFPPSEIVDLQRPTEAGIPLPLTVAFMGLTGPSGALPRYYTEILLERARQKDHTLRDFLDLFNHRLISLFVRAWEKYRYWIAYERAEIEGRKHLRSDPRKYRAFIMEERPRLDLFADSLLSLSGLGVPTLRYRARARESLQPRTAVADETFRFYVGLLSQQHRSAIGLQGLVADYFQVSVEILQLCGQWLNLEPEIQTCLHAEGETLLGQNAIIGERFWDRQGKFRIRLGPLTYERFRDFLPSGSAIKPLAHLARFYAGRQFDIDVQSVLIAAEVPWCQLSANPEDGAHLGWNTWIRCHEFTADAEDVVLTIAD